MWISKNPSFPVLWKPMNVTEPEANCAPVTRFLFYLWRPKSRSVNGFIFIKKGWHCFWTKSRSVNIIEKCKHRKFAVPLWLDGIFCLQHASSTWSFSVDPYLWHFVVFNTLQLVFAQMIQKLKEIWTRKIVNCHDLPIAWDFNGRNETLPSMSL